MGRFSLGAPVLTPLAPGARDGGFVSTVGFRLLLQVVNISILLFNDKLVTLHLKLLKMQNPRGGNGNSRIVNKQLSLPRVGFLFLKNNKVKER